MSLFWSDCRYYYKNNQNSKIEEVLEMNGKYETTNVKLYLIKVVKKALFVKSEKWIIYIYIYIYFKCLCFTISKGIVKINFASAKFQRKLMYLKVRNWKNIELNNNNKLSN